MDTQPLNFRQHLDRIRQAKREADAMLEVCSPGHNAAEAVLGILWEVLFDHMCHTDAFDLDELNTLSTIIHKLMAGNTQLKSLELKIRDDARKEDEFRQRKEQLATTLRTARENADSLSEAKLREIEAQLKLL